LKRTEFEAFLDKQLPAEIDRAFDAAAGAERDALQKSMNDRRHRETALPRLEPEIHA
jgi:hypothetical protein